MKKIYVCAFLICSFYSTFIYSQGTITFTGATDNGATVQSETITGSVYVTVSTTDGAAAADIFDLGGSHGNTVVVTRGNQSSGASEATLTFSMPVDVSSIFIYDGFSAIDQTWTITPSPIGTNTPATATSVGFAGKTVNTSFSNVTSISITISGGSNTAGIGVDDIVISSVLPVELTLFTASVNGNAVNLKWQTATEVNNYGFEVQRSQKSGDGSQSWEKIEFVKGSGNSNSPHDYSFVDQPSGGTTFSYRLKQIDNDGKYKYYDAITVTLNSSGKAKLMQNSPNPFNPTTAIKFYIPNNSDVTIKIYDMLGREVTTLINNQTTAGYHIVYWNGKDSYGRDASSGVYLYRLTAGNFVQTKKMLMMK